jgi:hypothetical protein
VICRTIFSAYANHHLSTPVEFSSDRMSYIKLKGRCCDIVLNVHAPTQHKSDDAKVASTRNCCVYSINSWLLHGTVACIRSIPELPH